MQDGDIGLYCSMAALELDHSRLGNDFTRGAIEKVTDYIEDRMESNIAFAFSMADAFNRIGFARLTTAELRLSTNLLLKDLRKYQNASKEKKAELRDFCVALSQATSRYDAEFLRNYLAA